MTTTPQPAVAAADATTLPTDAPWLLETPGGAPPAGPRLSLFDLLIIVARQRRLILKSMLICGVLALLLSYLSPKMYESYVTFLPPAQTALRGMNSVGDISAALSAAAGTSFKSAEDFWTSVLKGRTVTDRVVNMFGIKQEYHVTDMSSAEAILRGHVSFDIDKAGLISIYVKDKDAKRAAELANGYIAAMHATMSDMTEQDANQRMAFFNSQVEQERGRLADAEKEMMTVERRTGVIALGGQTSEAISQIGDLRARITEKTVELQALRSSATDQNPEVQRLKSEIGADQTALAQLETEQGKPGLGDISAQQVPQATLDYIRATRDLRYHESLLDALGKQVEAAQLDIARSAPMIEVVDVAVPAEHPSGLGRKIWVLAGLLIGFFIGLGFGVLRHFYRQLKSTPEGQAKIHELSAAIRGKA